MLGRILFKKQLPRVLTRSWWKKESPNVTLSIDGKEITVPRGTLLVEAIKKAASTVPTMCYHPDVAGSGGICRVCLVEDGQRPGVPIVSCKTFVDEGMKITTTGTKSTEYRQSNAAMMFSTHPNTCITCPASTKCIGQATADKLCVAERDVHKILPTKDSGKIDATTAIYKDKDRCINCDICVHTCKMQGIGALAFYNQEGHSIDSMGTMNESECVQCGQCINRCPTGALSEAPEVAQVLEAIKDPSKLVVFQTAPAIRVGIAEEFGCKPGERILKNELVTGLKSLGPNVYVMDTDFSADLTIIEEGYELIERLHRTLTGKKLLGGDHMTIDLPMFTSCCPAWIVYVEKNFPELTKNLSTAKSPMQMLSAMTKSYWAKDVKKVDPKKVVNVAIMPCTAKKQEKSRDDLKMDYGDPATDHVLTTRELARLFKQANIDPTKLPKTPFDKVMGDSTGAAVIFGATGGVMEAALRTAYEVITGRPVPFKDLNILPVRGMEGIREAKIKFEKVLPKYAAFEGVTLSVAVAHGPQNARKIVEIVKQAKENGKPAPWHFIEIMVCPGGCIGGGGQPKPTNMEIRKERTKLIFKEDMELPLRKSHENPEVTALYTNFLKEPLGQLSHHLLHRTYTPNPVRNMEHYVAGEADGLEGILKKYPREQQYLLPIVIEEADKKGYISDPSLVMIAKHVGMYPGHVEAILSSYHYFPRKKTSNTHIYLCRCHNCVLKGQMKVLKTIEDKFGLSSHHGGVSKDGKFTLHTANWLGWCVNDAPAMMVKRTGSTGIDVVTKLTADNIGEYIESLTSGKLALKASPDLGLLEIPKKDGYSFMTTRLDVPQVVNSGTRMRPKKVCKLLRECSLVGRGGAGFNTALKWESAMNAKDPEKYVVCNADEGLPSTYKDWWILRDQKRQEEVLAGMGICAKTIGAKKCYLYLRYEYRNFQADIEKSIKHLHETCPRLRDVSFEVRLGGGPYVAGEENAQFESIQGAAPLPRKDRPSNVFPTVSGLFNKPTVINNVETFWAVSHIISQGTKPFAKTGLPKLLSVSGDVEKPTLKEASLNGYTLQDLLEEVKAKDTHMAEVGGATESLLLADSFKTPFGFGRGTLNAVGSVVLFDKTRDILDVYQDKLDFMLNESCRQCVPCRDGSALLAQAFRDMRAKKPVHEQSLKLIAEAAGATSICAHGKALNPLFTAACKQLENELKSKSKS